MEIIGHPTSIITILQNKTVKEAAQAMIANKVGCLIVNDPHGEFVGLVTERDIAHWIGKGPKDASGTLVEEIMTSQVVSCPPGTPTGKAREIMATHRIRHLPIVDKGVVVGILSARDLMGQQLEEDRAAAQEVAMLSNCLKSIELKEAADTVATEAPKLFQAHQCVLCLYREGNTMQPPELESHNECLRPQESLREALDGGQLSDRDALFVEQVPCECGELGAHGPRLIIPIQVCGTQEDRGQSSGMLSGYLCMCGLEGISNANPELVSYKAKLAKEILTSHLTNATLYQHARLTSMTDALTGVGSRKMLEDNLQIEYDRARRYQTPFTVVIIDLDNFKTINDVLGHGSGDEALKRLADSMRQQKRLPDVLVRYGGDEFVILMPQTTAEDALVLVERLREQVHQIKLALDTPLTVSCGIAECLLDRDTSPGDLMRRADLALYEAKGAGRDCVRLWEKTMTKLLNTNDIEIGKVKQLQRRVAGLSEKAEKMFMQSIWSLVQTLEAKNPYAQNHSQNVTSYALGIAKVMAIGPKHTDIICRAAMLHDIGKIGIPDEILSKPGPLTPRERRVIEQHPVIGVRILEKMNFLEREIAIVRHHHEKWNGHGYPDGISQTAIPVGARILAVADTLDALTSPRSYRDPLSLPETLKILVDSSGYEFDPDVTKALVQWIETVATGLGKPADQVTVHDLRNDQGKHDPEVDTPVDREPAQTGVA
jgi:diguanylate cyclase (GGDEF)-like protein/putative nucleotidyltransferase with HDIG domain